MFLLGSFHIQNTTECRGRIQRKTWCMLMPEVDYNITLCPLQSRLHHIYHGQPYARVDFIPQSGTFDLASESYSQRRKRKSLLSSFYPGHKHKRASLLRQVTVTSLQLHRCRDSCQSFTDRLERPEGPIAPLASLAAASPRTRLDNVAISRMLTTGLACSYLSKYKVDGQCSCLSKCERLASLTAASQSTRLGNVAAQQNVSDWPPWQLPVKVQGWTM
jgi:hypothetical protein